MSDWIRLDIDIINMRFEYSDTDTVSDVDIRTRIRTDLNPSKWIRFRIRSENIRTVFIPTLHLENYKYQLEIAVYMSPCILFYQSLIP